MSAQTLTDEERAAFQPEITRDRALDYFYVFDNVPLQFIYRDKLIPGEPTNIEARNRAITETLWTDAYHQYLVCNVPFMFTYRGSILQMPLQIHQFGAGAFKAPAAEDREFAATADSVRDSFDAWMESEGWQIATELRKQPPTASWRSLLGTPDRSMRIASLIAVGNQVLLELISTWTEDGNLMETAWVVVLIYDVDGTVLQDRSYIEMSNWPSARKRSRSRPDRPHDLAATRGVMDGFYDYQRDLQSGVTPTEVEKQNLSIIEGAWLDANNGRLDSNLFNPERFRMQLPLQKCSFNLAVATEVHDIVKRAAPDSSMRLALTYAKGNQVVAEGVLSWSEDGGDREAPFISFILLDGDGLVIRERRYLTMGNWPGANGVTERLGLR